MTDVKFLRMVLVTAFCLTLLGWGVNLKRVSKESQMASVPTAETVPALARSTAEQ